MRHSHRGSGVRAFLWQGSRWLGSRRLTSALLAAVGGCAATLGCEAEPAYVGTVPDVATCGAGRCYLDAGIEREEALERFSAPRNGLGPRLVYPLHGSVLPANWSELTVQWHPGDPSHRHFRLRVVAPEQEPFDFYVPCHAAGRGAVRGCSFRLPDALWHVITETARGERLALQLWGQGDESGLGASEEIEIELANHEVGGALYYWSLAAETHVLRRWVFASPSTTDVALPAAAGEDNRCAGCHAVSRDGSTLALTVGDADPTSEVETNAAFAGRLYTASVSSPQAPFVEPTADESDSSMMALTSDGSRVLTSFHQRLVLRDARTGEVEQEVDPESFAPGERAFFPEFAPDDQSVVVTLAVEPEVEGEPLRQFAVRNGRIAVLPLENGRFGPPPRILVPSDPELFHFYPTWSPDGNWVVFVSAPRGGGGDSYSRRDARLRIVAASGGPVHELTAASGHTSTWPRFVPGLHCPAGTTSTCAEDERLYFLSFSTKRDYGYLLDNATLVQEGEGLSQLWVTALDTRHLRAGRDPSHPPAWIPAQHLTASNHSGSWAERAACQDDDQCAAGETCETASRSCVVSARR